jgi:hypothetical protein
MCRSAATGLAALLQVFLAVGSAAESGAAPLAPLLFVHFYELAELRILAGNSLSTSADSSPTEQFLDCIDHERGDLYERFDKPRCFLFNLSAENVDL